MRQGTAPTGLPNLLAAKEYQSRYASQPMSGEAPVGLSPRTTMKVPERHHSTLVQLLTAPPETRAALKAALDQAEPALLLKDLERSVVARAGIEKLDVPSVLSMLVSMGAARQRFRMSADEFAGAVLDAAHALEGLPPQMAWGDLKRDLAGMLGSTSLAVTAKSLEVMTDHAKVFQGARVLTDLRPVFDDPGKQPVAAVVVHQLKIDYVENKERNTFFVALDKDDIEQLKRELERATLKEKGLRSLAEGSRVRLLT